MAKTKNYAEVIQKQLSGNKEQADAVSREILNANIAMQVYALRTNAGLTQTQLADLINTSQPVIARLEDADYYGRSLTLLHRIASALGFTIELNFQKSPAKEDAEFVSGWVFEQCDVMVPPTTTLPTAPVKTHNYDITEMIAGGQAA